MPVPDSRRIPAPACDERFVGGSRPAEVAAELAERPSRVEERRRPRLAEHRTKAAPPPVGRAVDHPRTSRIVRDVARQLEAVALLLDRLGVEPPLKQMPDPSVTAVVRLRVAPAEQLHPARERPIGHVEHEMHVVRHEAVDETPPAELPRHHAQKLEVPLPVVVVREDRLPPVPAARHVVDPGRLHTKRTGHAHDARPRTVTRQSRLGRERAAEADPAALTSGCPDSNWGPLRPERSALPGCATPRTAPPRVAAYADRQGYPPNHA